MATQEATEPECSCDICERGRHIATVKHGGDVAEMLQLIDDLSGQLLAVEFDNNYYTAIFDGSWPQAREILTRALARIPSTEATDGRQTD